MYFTYVFTYNGRRDTEARLGVAAAGGVIFFPGMAGTIRIAGAVGAGAAMPRQITREGT